MSNIQKYTEICKKEAKGSAQRLRSLANTADNASTRNTIKIMATELQDLVSEMADQLEAERAEMERMSRLYAMARKDSRDAQETIIRLMGDKEEAMLAEVELQRTINELKAKAQETGYDPDFHRMQSDGSH